jgi:hypothetical protein
MIDFMVGAFFLYSLALEKGKVVAKKTEVQSGWLKALDHGFRRGVSRLRTYRNFADIPPAASA